MTGARLSTVQRAKVGLRIGSRTRLTATAHVTSGGIIAIGAVVSSILLSTAMLVRVAKH